MPIRYALLEWFRAAELSCDRAAALLTRDPQAVCRSLMVLSRRRGGRASQPRRVHQAGHGLRGGGSGLERLSRLFQDLNVTHPMPVKRVRELLDWVREGDYDRIVGGEYIRIGEEPPLREEGDAAAAHYGERVKGAFEKAGTSIGEVGDQLVGLAREAQEVGDRLTAGSSRAAGELPMAEGSVAAAAQHTGVDGSLRSARRR